MVDTTHLWEPPKPEYYAELLLQIGRNGITHPITVDQHGNVLDGHTRRAIAAELEIDCPQIVRHVADDAEAIALAVAYNGRHRKLQEGERERVIAMLRRAGKSDRTIAELLAIGHATVSRAGKPTVSNETVGKDGRTRPRRQASVEEQERRRAHIADLYEHGYGTNQIAKALGVGNGTVDTDLAVAGVRRTGGRKRTDTPESVKWRDGEDLTPVPKRKRAPTALPVAPVPQAIKRYETSRVVGALQLFTEAFGEEDFGNVFAWHVTEAVDDKAETWLRQNESLCEQVHDQVGRLLRVMRDPQYRTACTDTTEGRENIRNLRLVTGDQSDAV
jgi:DNA-binding NarL/FixJ family response regulator